MTFLAGASRAWRAAFLVGVGMFIGSLAFLAAVVANGLDEEAAAIPADSGSPSASSTAPIARPGQRVTYLGRLPAALSAEGLDLVAQGAKPDITFVAAESGGVVIRWFVPVAALGTGVDSLTTAQLRSLAAGQVRDWKDVGGVGGKVTFAAAGDEDEVAFATRFAGAAPSLTFPTFDALVAAMTLDSGILAFLPIEKLGPAAVAVAVDGVDLVRGRGDASTWPFAERVSITAGTDRGNAVLARVTTRATAAVPKTTTIVATGDILQARCSLPKIQATGDWAAALRSPVGDYLRSADLALTSLDASIQDISPPFGCIATTNLTSPAETIAALTYAGIDEATVATNHVFDCGQQLCGSRGFLRMLDLLHAASIKTVGGGKDLAEALAPAIFEVNGVRIGVLGYDDIAAEDLEASDTSPGTAPLDDDYSDEQHAFPREPAFYKPADMLHLERMTAAIKALKQQVDVVIVQVQSGYEDTHDASPRSIKALRAAADAGADLVVGNQGHWVQPVEVRGGTFVAYALGNFIFDQVHTPEHTQGYLLEATLLGNKFVGVRLVPYAIVDQYKPTFVEGTVRAKVLRDVFTASKSLPAPQ